MNKLLSHTNTFLMLCLASVVAISACSSTTGMQRSENVQASMKTVDNDIKLIVVQLDAIGSSLNELTKPGQADVKQAFNLFSKNTSEIKKMQKDFAKHSSEMEANGKAYFKEWNKNTETYDNPEIQQRSEERRAELARTYDKIAQNNVGVKEAFKTYVSEVNQIERFLSNDLTSGGIDAISTTSNKVVNKGSHLKNELKNLQSAIEEAREQMRRS
jgi:hypothetical protein